MIRFLIVESDPAERERLKAFIGQNKFEHAVSFADDGQSARAHLRGLPQTMLPDVIFAAVDLPGTMSGWDMVRSIRVVREYVMISVIMMVPRPFLDSEVCYRLGRYGADGYVVKPTESSNDLMAVFGRLWPGQF